MAGKDYGPKGCCGPSTFGVLFLLVVSMTSTVRLARKNQRKSGGKR